MTLILRAHVSGNQLQRVSGGRGTYILTASTGLQVAQERESDGYGLLTKHIIHGVRQGAADLDRDGLITMDELIWTAVRIQTRISKPASADTLQIQFCGCLDPDELSSLSR
jgi:hypothetical protein